MGDKEYMTVQQAAERLGVHPSRVKALIKAGKLPAQKLGHWVWMIADSDLDEFERNRNTKAGRPRK
jgi:excisionase family DNA binding protein